MSGFFHGGQINWPALTEDTYVTYMSIKKLAYYIQDSNVTPQRYNLPLKMFLEKNTMNSNVTNWVVEISPFKIKFEYIKGIKNTLSDTMSRLSKFIHTIIP